MSLGEQAPPVGSGRYLRVVGALAGVCAVVALCGLVDQFSGNGSSELLEKKAGAHVQIGVKELQRLENIMLKQQKMEGREQLLLSSIEKGEKHAALALEGKKIVHALATHKTQKAAHAAPAHTAHKAAKAAAPHPVQAVKKAAKPVGLTAVRAPSVSLSETSSAPAPAEDKTAQKIADLKAQLAQAEAEQKAHQDATAHVAAAKEAAAKTQQAAAAPAAAPAAAGPLPVTGKDFAKLPDDVATTKDDSIAKEAGLKPMGWMGSANQVDAALKKLHCDPRTFECSGTAAEKKQAIAIVEQIQNSIMNDGKQTEAYAWTEEHALPPAPHM